MPLSYTVKTCKECGSEKPVSQFYQYRKNEYVCTSTLCKTCHVAKNVARTKKVKHTEEFKQKRRQVERRRSLKRLHGMTVEQYDELLANQRGCCAVCEATEPGNKAHSRFSVDHDHSTGENRGLLCHPCNVLVGACKENISVLQSAIYYLVKHGAVPNE